MEEFAAHMVVINTLVELSFVSFLMFIFPHTLYAMGNLSVSVDPRTFIFTRSLDFESTVKQLPLASVSGVVGGRGEGGGWRGGWEWKPEPFLDSTLSSFPPPDPQGRRA